MSERRPGAFRARLARALVPATPFLWLSALFLLPLAIVLKISLSDPASAQPPYRPLFNAQSWRAVKRFFADLDLENYATVFGDDLYAQAALSSFRIALLSTLLLILVGYPMALGMARVRPERRTLLLALVILPFWTSFLIRIYAWVAILKPEGFLTQALMGLGLISEPLEILNTETAVYIGIVYAYLPFMVLPLYATLEKMDDTLLEAALDLGSPPWRSFWTITVPLAMPGIVAGSLLCFIPAVGEFVIPDLLGGSETLMIGRQLWSEFFSNRDWPLASAVAILLLLTLVVPIVIYRDVEARRVEARP
jgi:putrescine transport system permease protein